MNTITTSDLEIAYLDIGQTDGPVAILLHGFPYDVCAYEDVGRHLTAAGLRCLIPSLRGFGNTRFLRPDTMRSGQQAAIGHDLMAFMDALDLSQACLAGFDWGGRAACIVAALHPDRVSGLVSCGQGYNIQDIAAAARPVSPREEARYWYMYYFATARGRRALEEERATLCRFIWSHWSPGWAFDEATFAASARAFDNPDFVDITVHSYTHRFGNVAGDPQYDEMERRLAAQPPITVPTIVLEGAQDGVDPPTRRDHARHHFNGPYERRVIPETGHNVPQEAPAEFAAAVLDVLGAGGAAHRST